MRFGGERETVINITKLTNVIINSPEKPAEVDQTGQVPIIERLRAANPTRHIVSVGVGLDDPVEMKQFFFQYAEELRNSRSEEVSQHPLDTARSHIIRVANHGGLKLAGRWHELFATGTVQEFPDHSMDWINPHGRFKKDKELRGRSVDDLLAGHHNMVTEVDAYSITVSGDEAKLERRIDEATMVISGQIASLDEASRDSSDGLKVDRELRHQVEDLSTAIKLDNIRAARKSAKERRALAKKERSTQPGAGLVEAERRLVDLDFLSDSPKINPSPVTL